MASGLVDPTTACLIWRTDPTPAARDTLETSPVVAGPPAHDPMRLSDSDSFVAPETRAAISTWSSDSDESEDDYSDTDQCDPSDDEDEDNGDCLDASDPVEILLPVNGPPLTREDAAHQALMQVLASSLIESGTMFN